jgi:hypothetical protein
MYFLLIYYDKILIKLFRKKQKLGLENFSQGQIQKNILVKNLFIEIKSIALSERVL